MHKSHIINRVRERETASRGRARAMAEEAQLTDGWTLEGAKAELNKPSLGVIGYVNAKRRVSLLETAAAKGKP